MPMRFEPKTAILPPAQREIWPQLAPAPGLSYVLYGGTAIALHLGHRQSLDFDFFTAGPLNKTRLASAFSFMSSASTVQEDPQTWVVSAGSSSAPVKVSFFGAINLGHVNAPLRTADDVLLVASLDDLMATKLKVILDRAEAKDYHDIAALLQAGVSLEHSLGAFKAMFAKDAALPLRALGYFKDGDLATLPESEQAILRAARDRVTTIPKISLLPGLLS
ncbi:MAG: nucleotidyl transferase AbiEii/AbiGii toxin family protein [Terriglobales bacterium]